MTSTSANSARGRMAWALAAGCLLAVPVGWLLAIITMGGLRRNLVFSRPLANFGDPGITAIIAGIMALGFIGFTGVTG